MVNPDSYFKDPISGFEAISFTNGTEIVISFAGTGTGVDWIHGNIPLAAGNLSDQFRQAADYYLQVKAANPNANISFTGHSLGGGLASLMAVMFGESATTFDQAPFRNAALTYTTTDANGNTITHSAAQDLLAYLSGETTNGQPTYSASQLQGLTNFINASVADSGVIPNEGNVTDINVQGEILSSLPFSRIGTQTDIPNYNGGASAVDLHSQALLTAFFQSNISASTTGDTLNNVTYKLTDLLRMIFDPSLFAHTTATTNTTDPNFLELIVNHEAGRDPLTNTTITPDAMVTRFTSDMWKIAQDGGLTMPGAVGDMLPDGTLLQPIRQALNRTLIAFAMQKYYEETGTGQGHGQALYTDIAAAGGSNGIRFDITDVSTRLQNEYVSNDKGMNFTATDPNTGQYLLKGYQYLQQFIGSSLFTAQEQQIIKGMLPVLRDWYVQAGAGGMLATDTLNRGAFMLGGNSGDALTGGTAADLLVGNAGDDVLQGKQGNDFLLGGTGNDAYVYTTGDGFDTILDSDGNGSIVMDGAPALTGGSQYGDNKVFQGKDANGTNHLYTFVTGDRATGGDLIVDGAMLIKDYRPTAGNGMGITLADAAPLTAPVIANDFIANPGQRTSAAGTNANDRMQGIPAPMILNSPMYAYGLGGDDILVGSGYHDWLEGGAGADIITGHSANNTMVPMGDSNTDILYGGAGDDRIYADVETDAATAIANGNTQTSSGRTGAWLSGGAGDDIVVGANDNDILVGGGGSDLLIGGAGNDFISGDATLEFVDGNFDWSFTTQPDIAFTGVIQTTGSLASATDGAADILYGGAGNDLLRGGLGNDILFGENDNDTLAGGEGNDTLLGGNGTDLLIGDDPTATAAQSGDDYLDGGAQDDVLYGFGGNDILVGGTGNDTLIGGAGQDTYVYNVGDGIDHIYDTQGEHNILRFGAGVNKDNIQLHLGSLMLDLGNGDAIHIDGFDQNNVFNSSSIDRFEFADGTTLTTAELLARGFDIDGTNGNDTLTGTDTTDRIHGLGGDDIIKGGKGDDTLYGEDGNDALMGNDGNDTLDGGAGDDQLYGFIGDDTLTGGAGSDALQGGQGNDTYRFSAGDGNDTIIDASGADTIALMGSLRVADVTLVKDGVNLRINFANTGQAQDSITLSGWYAGNNTVATLTDSNGGSIDLRILGQTLTRVTQTGATGADTLTGSTYNDIFQGGAGNDILLGGAGDDTYLFNIGDGHDQIYELGGNDVIQFGAGITPDMLNLGFSVIGANGPVVSAAPFPDPDADLIIYEDQRQVLTVTVGNQGDAIDILSGKSGVEKFRFADGTEYTWQQLVARQGGATITGSGTLDGLGMAATFQGGAGGDILYGGGQNDTYLFNTGDGQDKIIDFGGVDQIVFGAGITAQDINWRYEQNNLGTRFAVDVGTNGDSIVIVDGEQGAVESFRFSDGTVLNFNDFLARQGGLPATPVQLGFAWQDGEVVLGTQGNDYISDSGERRSVYIGGKGNDTLNTYEMQDLVFNLGDGQDTINLTGYNSDTLVFGAGITPDSINVTLYERGNRAYDLRIQYGVSDQVYAANVVLGDQSPQIQRVKFNDGTVWSNDDLVAHATHEIHSYGAVVTGTQYNDRIVASATNKVLAGGAGNDTYVINQAGNYTIADTSIVGVSGNSVELGWASWQSFPTLTQGSFELDFGNGTTIHIEDFDPNNVYGAHAIDSFKFSDGAVFTYEQLLARGFDLNGTQGNDRLTGTNVVDRIHGSNGNDTLDGGAGNDRLYGEAGDDTLIGGGGVDALYGGDGNDVLISGDNVNPAFNGAVVTSTEEDGTIPSATPTGAANSYMLHGTISATNQYGGDDYDFYKLANLSAGTVLSAATFSQFDTMLGLYDAAGNLLMYNDDAGGAGGSLNSVDSAFQYTLSASGDYYLSVVSYDSDFSADPFAPSTYNNGISEMGDYVATVSFSGNYLTAPQNSILEGGWGNDILNGGIGSNTYNFRLGDGQDTITDHDAMAGNLDVLSLKDALPTNVTLAANGNDLVVNVGSAGDSITIKNWLLAGDTSYRVENIAFADGTVWDAATIAAMVNPVPVNHAPAAAAIAAQNATQGQAFSFNAATVFSDPDAGDVLTLSASLANGNPLPSWLTFDAAARTFGGTPGNADVGGLNLTVTATDAGGLSASANFALAVANVNDAPVVAVQIADQMVAQGAMVSLTIPAGAFTDQDIVYGDSLTYSASLADPASTNSGQASAGSGQVFTALPAWLTFDAATQTLSGTAGMGDLGVLPVRITATDTGGLSATGNFNLTVANMITGTIYNDTINGTAGLDYIQALAGNDVVNAGDGNDIIIGGAGSDVLAGGAGDDTFQISGTDTAYDRFQGDAGYDVIQGGAGDDTIRVNYFIGASTVEKIDGGLGVNVIAGTQYNDTIDLSGTELANIANIDGGVGNDVITGSAGNDLIIGGAGSDVLAGGAGDDTFLISGTDTAYDRFQGDAGYDVIQGGAGDDTIRVNYFTGASTVEKIDGGLGVNVIAGTQYNDTIDLSGTELVNIANIDGGVGNDVITGSSGNDIIIGGAGSDVLAGGAGDDTFLVEGNDTAYDRFQGDDGYDTILGGAGDDVIRVNYFTGTSTVERIDGGLGVNVVAGTQYNDTIDLSGTELVNIANIDGGVGNDVITGSAGNDIIIGGAGSDVLAGGAGDDTFLISGTDTAYDRFQGDAGYDVIQGGAGDDTIRVNYFTGASTVEKIDGGLGVNVIAGTQYNDTIDLSGTELVNIANIDGGVGNDVITGSAGDDIIIGGAGSDVLAGGAGDDTFLISGSDTAYDRFQGDAGYDVIQGSAGDDVIRVNYFSGASTVEKIDGGAGLNIIAGTQYNDTIDLSGTELANIANIDGGVGNDVITGSAGNDLIIGGAGSDVLAGGAGGDTFLISGTDTAYDRFQGDAGYDTILGGDGDDTIRVNYFTGASTVEKIDGGAGLNIISGTQYNDTLDMSGTELVNIANIDGGAGNDVITGSAGNDIIIGGAGSDVLAGGAGDDTFLISGTDTAYDRFQGDAGYDVIQGSAGDDVIRVNYFTGASTAEKIDGGAGLNIIAGTQYNDTLDMSGTELVNIANIDGGAGNDVITGSAGNDLLLGGDGNDTLNGAAGNDLLQGGLGNDTLTDISGKNLFDGGAGTDTLTGGSGNELFIGGTGNDTLTTGTGADVIAFNRGDGQDTVVAPSTGSGQAGTADNTISLGGGIGYQNLAMSKSGNNLILAAGNGDQITMQNWFSSTSNRSIANLQIVLDASTYNASSSDPLLNHQVQSFDFALLAQNFDQALAANPTLTAWNLTDSLLSAHLAGSDTEALGGDLAYQYNLNGSLAGIGLASAQAVMGDASFGVAPQLLHPLAGLQTGVARLG